MSDALLGLLAIAVGLLFCFRGYVAMRTIIALWGAFAGFVFGAGLIAGTSDDGFLRTTTAWIVGLVFALVFGALAYFYYQLSVILAMATVGFVLGTTLLAALGVDWSWLIVLAGLVGGAALAVLAVVTNLPALVLIVLTALGGASAAVFGLMLLVGTIDTSDLEAAATTEQAADNPWWYLLYLVLAIAGIVGQSSVSARRSAQQQWQAGPTV
jgi:hypothetical protein